MRKNKAFPLIIILTLALLTTACSKNPQTTPDINSSPNGTNVDSTPSASDPVENNVSTPEDNTLETTEDFTIESEDGNSVLQEGSVITILSGGEYTLSGVLNGSIVVAVSEEEKVTLNLNNVIITCSDKAPVYIQSASKVTIKANADTYNVIRDTRSEYTESAFDTDTPETGSGAITSKTDLTVSGTGTLIVTGSYKNGIHSSKDLTLKNLTLKVTAANNAVKGKDSVTIKDVTAIFIAENGDGIKTEDSDISSSGNQRGTISISGGSIDVYAACDGISASYDLTVKDDTALNIYTSTYSDYSDDPSQSAKKDFYIIVSSSVYSESNLYYAYYYNDDYANGVWKNASFYTMVSSGRTRYYGLLLNAPSDYKNVQFFVFDAGSTPSFDSYKAASDNGTINTSMNAYVISSISGSKLSGDWNTLTTGSGNSSSKTSYSSKGMKAGNSVNIESGTIYIYCMDDGIHANSEALENGTSGAGNVTINGGSLVIKCADDGIHADNELVINGGYVHVVSSYEGLEGNLITINSGNIIVYASDDGINACSGKTTPCITVNGGYTEVTTASGDTDGIDSNGYYKQTGGFVLIKGGSAQGNVAGSLDTDKGVTVTGGTIIAFGGICETPEDSVNGYTANGTSFAAGSYTLTDADGNKILEITLPSTYSSMWVSSDLLKTGTTYSFNKDGSSMFTWTQTAGHMGGVTGGGFGPGGQGGQGGQGGPGFPGGPGGGRY